MAAVCVCLWCGHGVCSVCDVCAMRVYKRQGLIVMAFLLHKHAGSIYIVYSYRLQCMCLQKYVSSDA